MKKIILLFFVFVILLSCATTGKNGNSLSLNEAINQAANEIARVLPPNSRVAIIDFRSNSLALSEYIIEELTTAIHINGIIDMADRRNLHYIRKELDFQLSGEVSDESAVSIGKFAGAQKIIIGEMIHIGSDYRFRLYVVDVEASTRMGGSNFNVRNDRNLRQLVTALDNGRINTGNYNFENIAPTSPGAFLDRGILFAVRGEFDIAIQDFSESIQLDRNYAAAYLQRGKALLASITEVVFVSDEFEDFDLYVRTFANDDIIIANSAIDDLTKAIAMNPTANAYKYRGISYDGLGDQDKAISDFTQGIRLAPNNVSIYNYRSIAYSRKGDFDRAIADCKRAIQIDPNYFLGYANLGSYYCRIGDYEQAIINSNIALKLDPNNGFIPNVMMILYNAHFSRGINHFSDKEYVRAIADFSEAIKFLPNSADAYYLRGNAYTWTNNFPRAIQDWERVLIIDPDYLEAKEALIEIRGW